MPSLVFVLLLLAVGCASPPHADLLFLGGPVYTLESESEHEVATALAVVGGEIAWVGSAEEVGTWRGPDTRVVDLAGRPLLPGFADAHLHLAGVARSLYELDLVGTRSFAEVVDRTAARAATLPLGTWILGRGWDQNDWPDTALPHHSALSTRVPGHPVLLERIDGHALLCNAAALAAAGIDRQTPEPPGGRIHRDADGAPTGVLVDNAMALVERFVPGRGLPESPERLREAVASLHRRGLTSIHDAGVDAATIDTYADMAKRGELQLRVHAMVRADEPALHDARRRWPTHDLTGHGVLAVRAIKVSADGALGSRGAALLEDYSDEPGQRGLLTTPPGRLLTLARFARSHGWQLATHAIGDRSNRIVLDVYEQALAEHTGPLDHRFRIEHAQHLHADDLPRFKALGVIPSMQAQHQTSDMTWAGARLGPERLSGAYAWRDLLDTGVVIPGGSDAPVERPDPVAAFHAAVTRRDERLQPAGGWLAEQCMTRTEALRHLTLWPAVAAFEERRLGSLRPGKRADLVVLSGDPMVMPADDLPGLAVDLTIFDGRVVYAREDAPGP